MITASAIALAQGALTYFVICSLMGEGPRNLEAGIAAVIITGMNALGLAYLDEQWHVFYG
jgi:hypothetical protein